METLKERFRQLGMRKHFSFDFNSMHFHLFEDKILDIMFSLTFKNVCFV